MHVIIIFIHFEAHSYDSLLSVRAEGAAISLSPHIKMPVSFWHTDHLVCSLFICVESPRSVPRRCGVGRWFSTFCQATEFFCRPRHVQQWVCVYVLLWTNISALFVNLLFVMLAFLSHTNCSRMTLDYTGWRKKNVPNIRRCYTAVLLTDF